MKYRKRSKENHFSFCVKNSRMKRVPCRNVSGLVKTNPTNQSSSTRYRTSSVPRQKVNFYGERVSTLSTK